MNKTTLSSLGLDFEVTYTIAGSYYPATQEEPAEYPQVVIISCEPIDPDAYDCLVHQGEIPESYFESEELYDTMQEKLTDILFN